MRSVWPAVLGVVLGAVGGTVAGLWVMTSPTLAPGAPKARPERGDAMRCLVDRELRLMDPASPYLPENGWVTPGAWPCRDGRG